MPTKCVRVRECSSVVCHIAVSVALALKLRTHSVFETVWNHFIRVKRLVLLRTALKKFKWLNFSKCVANQPFCFKPLFQTCSLTGALCYIISGMRFGQRDGMNFQASCPWISLAFVQEFGRMLREADCNFLSFHFRPIVGFGLLRTCTIINCALTSSVPTTIIQVISIILGLWSSKIPVSFLGLQFNGDI